MKLLNKLSPATKDVFYKVGLFAWYAMGPALMSVVLFGEPLLAIPFYMIFVALSAFCNAIMDSIDGDHIHSTIFKSLNPRFWNKTEAAKKGYFIFKYRLDGWHIFKSATLIFGGLAVVFFEATKVWYMDLISIGYFYILVFNLFYTHIFKRPKNG